MKKSLIIIFISIVFLSPQFALASWWNPFSWFNKKPVIPVEEIKVEVPQKPTPVIKPVEKKGVILNSKPTVKKTSSPINSQTKETGKENKPNPLSPVVPPTINEPKAAALSISNVNIDPKTTSVYISWQTNMASESKLLLNGTAYQSKNGVDALHYVEIKDLNAGRSYTGSITALANNAWANQEITFSTKPTPPATILIKKEIGTLAFISGGHNGGNINLVKNGVIEQTLWEAVASVGVKDLEITSLKLRNVGSAQTSAFSNLKLYINENFVSSVSSVDANGYANFDFPSIKLSVGNVSFRFTGDIKSGNSRTVQFSLRNSSDINVVEIDTKEKITPSGTPISSIATTFTIEPGRLTITKSTDSPSGTVLAGASNVVLARYKLEAFNEEIRFGSLRITLKTNNDNLNSLRNVALYVDGTKISYSYSLKEESIEPHYLDIGATFAPLKLLPSQSVIVEVRGDIYDDDGTNDVASGNTIQIILLPGNANAQLVESLSSLSVPTGQLLGNILSVIEP
ncbi:hypothetical protein A2W67_01105 [Candidatus Nomurabacteria bacterium RIFCSPLOWO2_02_40_28]|uniref:Uncharacterized protein n=2 Tax=Candidatus Nomuraibacteriota TaxID=1752729 RepID=A0A837HUF5_9BACT|nr:MAG: hypothetical protein UT27_C0001G0048 [Candidatus Nomurabacteria bacterium GW2011_GWD2_39_12]KKR20685.1 MAG: hypothetical protein UT51_C0002G0120 [Candidatus Nomurabacteria bacterium GW2011_GWC2_39_41]KKR38634.1 MAG: hypothetical protein UT73_C0002G0119 [Candidatus Nomurabacteria bacterium GW2011_GWB1_40_11]KKR40359.1 MAG: hypothetical protein UT74_C0001G0093 [Parcubacteria group bacterium GW2011_GWC1_40_11]KKR59532.1 MAG: hypothetical protein UT98_C0001G0120 [Candidatus Nomurabacteria b